MTCGAGAICCMQLVECEGVYCRSGLEVDVGQAAVRASSGSGRWNFNVVAAEGS